MAISEDSGINRNAFGTAPTGGVVSNDPMNLSNSDHPGATLVASIFDGSNFLSWSRGVQMALGAKLKLGFIDGTLARPPLTSPDYQRWLRIDFMVRCWIINSMDVRIGEGFMYVNSSKQLWDEILERYPPPGYSKALPGQVCLLKRSLYGLKQASRQWNIELTKFLSPICSDHANAIEQPRASLHILSHVSSKKPFHV